MKEMVKFDRFEEHKLEQYYYLPMNRQIKFRVWDEKNKKMFNEPKLFEIIKVYDNQDDLLYRVNYNSYVNLDVIQQFTGLKDRNKKDIYEGDILSYDDRDGYAEVKWDEEDGSYYLDGKNLNWLDVFADKRRWYKCEIMGNIFENPELLIS